MEAEEFPLKDEESPLKDEELVLDLTFADMDMLLSGLDFAFPLIEDDTSDFDDDFDFLFEVVVFHSASLLSSSERGIKLSSLDEST
jgi:hypothetical protein